jgi:hypothetical protein
MDSLPLGGEPVHTTSASGGFQGHVSFIVGPNTSMALFKIGTAAVYGIDTHGRLYG